jgi:alpha-amylase/alpha-mannosidase (GH57 family)
MPEPVRLVVHGHFYQPPRENPWTEEVPVEASASPFHDWNERITDECYRPNGWARVVDEHGRVRGIVDNYRHLSFNVGPTLLSWLEVHHPDVLARMVEADAAGGGAVAQAYNHLILPLANERDVRTQVRWGLADFAHRFGRPATGMWLPETAVNDAVLAVLVEEGVASAVLAPGQAVAVRPLGSGDEAWVEVADGSIAAGMPHRWWHPDGSGRSIDLVFYDGPLSHDLAFALSGLTSQALIARVRASGADGTPVVVATDGETFGHHHTYAERALAYAFAHEAPANGVEVLHLRALLAAVPATHEVRVRESAWSCAHGVGRWKEDCGCETGGEPGWNQAWRAPLRQALDVLRDHGIEVFERRGAGAFEDPWAARDAYVRVLLGAVEPDAFAADVGRAGADPVEALTLLEAQRQALLMYTSCGWFFNDLAGIETVQVLRYAARLVDLFEEVGEPAPLDRFLAVLGEARSNRPEEGSGADIWRRHVEPSRVDPARVVSHLALLDLLEHRESAAVTGGHEVVDHQHRHQRRGGVAAVSGRVVLRHCRTRRVTEHVYAAVRLAGLEVVGAVRPADPAGDEEAFARFDAAAEHGERVTALLRVIDQRFGPREFGLEAALPEAAGDIVASAAHELADRFAASLESLWVDSRDVLGSLATAGHPLEPELRAPVEFALGRRLRNALATVAGPEGDDLDATVAAVRAATDVAWEAHRLGVHLAHDRIGPALADAVEAATRRAVADGDDDARSTVVRDLLRLRRPLGIGVNLDRAQELVVDALDALDADGDGASPRLRSLAAAIGVAVGPR